MDQLPQDNGSGAARIYRSETPAKRTQSLPSGDGHTPVSRQLPPGGNKIQRISQHTKGLFEDVTSWVDLKIQLTRIEIEERIETRLNQLLVKAGAFTLYALAGLFALFATALGIAAILIALGLSYPLSYFLGFLFVCILLGILGVIAGTIKAKMVKVGDNKAHVDEDDLVFPLQSRPSEGREVE
ncbi:MAG TPA: phage holin family protein [Rhodothermales bacterium]|nr:phage holin family protein [Rhodothermales bacterium]